MVKKVPKNGVLGTLRCRQIGRRELNRKTVMIDRLLVLNYPLYKYFPVTEVSLPSILILLDQIDKIRNKYVGIK